MEVETFLQKFGQLTQGSGGIKKLRLLILQLAITGKLSPAKKVRVTKRLGEVCEIINGGTPDTKILEYWDGEHLWATPKDMGKLKSLYIDNTERKITDLGLKNSSAKLLPIHSIILSTRAPIGYLAINKKEVSTNQGCKGIIPKKELSVFFLYYFLKSSVDLLNDLGSGTTFKELSGAKLREIQIPLPPPDEQKRIVTKANELMALCDQLDVLIKESENLNEQLFDSIIYQICKDTA